MTLKPMSIYSDLPTRSGPLRLARPSAPPDSSASAVEAPAIARLVLVPRTTPTSITPEVERAITDVLASKPKLGETIDLAFRRIERELASLFAQLTPAEARALKQRFELVREDDAVAARFNRLVANRRLRLLAFLGDARRREALTAARNAV